MLKEVENAKIFLLGALATANISKVKSVLCSDK